MMLADLTVPSAPAVLGWLATYLIHSTCWLAGAWLVARGLRAAAWRGRLWRAAVFGGLASATLVSLLDTSRLAWNLAPEAATPPAAVTAAGEDKHRDGVPIALDLSGGERALPPVAAGHERPPVSAAPSTASLSTPAKDGSGFGWRWLLAVWVVVAVVGLVHLAHQHRRLARALASRRRLFNGSLFSELARLRAAAGRRGRTRLSVTSSLSSPIALARGEIVVPERVLERLSKDERATLLAHELAHLERRDAWWLLALSVVERLFVVQPLNRLATKRAMAAAELACDEQAARWTKGGIELARCLVEVASWTERSPATGLAAGLSESPSALYERVERLLNPPAAPRRQGMIVGLWLAVSLGVLACGGPRVTTAPDDGEAIAEVPVEILEEREPMEMAEPLEDPEAVVVRAEILELSRDNSAEPSEFLLELQEWNARQVEQREQFSDLLGWSTRQGLLEQQVSDLEAQRARLKQGHSKWKLIQAQIDDLRDQIAVLSARREEIQNEEDARITDILGILDGFDRSQRALHAFRDDDGTGPYSSAVGEHVLALHRDDSIWCGEMPLVHAGSTDLRLLRHHLAAIAQRMPVAPLSADRPDGPQLPDERLELRIDATAPHYLLQRVLETCGRREVQIWQFDLVRVDDGILGAPLRFALPRDVGVAVEEGAPARKIPLEIRLRGLAGADPARRMLEYRARYATDMATNDDGESVPVLESRTTAEVVSLGSFLREAYAAMPRTGVIIDARAGTLYAEVLAVIDLLVEVGFTDITFVGEYKK